MPEPLTPPDCDLHDFPYMPLDVARLRDSEAAVVLSAEEFRAAIMLWCAAWHQVPAASLPADDRLLANLAGYGRSLNDWLGVKAGAMRGFIACDDGRFYHPVVAEKALQAQAKRRSEQKRTAKATAAAAAKRQEWDNVGRDGHRNGARDQHRNGQQGKRKEGKRTDGKSDDADAAEPARRTAKRVAEDRLMLMAMLPRLFNEFMAVMPERMGGHPKKGAQAAFRAVIRDGQDPHAIIKCAQAYRADSVRNGTAGTAAITAADTWLVSRPWANAGPAGKCTAGYALAKTVAGIAGRGDEFEMAGWGGAAQRAQVWLDNGWSEETILASVRQQAARRSTAANSISYFEKGIAEQVARLSAPLPTVPYTPATQVKREKQSTGNVVGAADRLVERIRQYRAT